MGDPIQIGFLIAIFGVMYFFFIRPQAKKAKEQEKFGSELKKGDKVIMTSGIHGKIVAVQEHTVSLEIGKNTVVAEKSSISKELTDERFNG